MSLCIIAASKTITFAVSLFTLSWSHSVQKTEWRETWAVTPKGLEIREAAVKGSGAGMEPGPDARLRDGWWVWHPPLPPQPRLSLAASGATNGGWLLCHEGGCLTIGKVFGDAAVLSPCP